MPDYSEQIGIIGEREPSLCAVSGRPVKGKNATTYYKGDGKHYVRVLNAYDDQWAQAAPYYGWPTPVIQENEPSTSPVFVLPETSTDEVNDIVAPSGDNSPLTALRIPAGRPHDTLAPQNNLVNAPVVPSTTAAQPTKKGAD